MHKNILNICVLGIGSIIFIGCNDGSSDSRGTVAYGAKLATADGMSSDENFSMSPCDDMDTNHICATPSEYRLGLDSINLVYCGGGACSIATNKQGFSNDRGSVDIEKYNSGAGFIAGETYMSTGRNDSTFVSARGVTLNMRYIEADFPDDPTNMSVETAYIGATVRLCLVLNCVNGAARGDYLVKLKGETSFKWFNTDNGNLESTKPTNFLKDANVAAGTVDGMGFSTTQGIIPVVLSTALTPTASTKFVVLTADVGRSLYCKDDAVTNGKCEPSEGETFWIQYPPQDMEFSLE